MTYAIACLLCSLGAVVGGADGYDNGRNYYMQQQIEQQQLFEQQRQTLLFEQALRRMQQMQMNQAWPPRSR